MQQSPRRPKRQRQHLTLKRLNCMFCRVRYVLRTSIDWTITIHTLLNLLFFLSFAGLVMYSPAVIKLSFVGVPVPASTWDIVP